MENASAQSAPNTDEHAIEAISRFCETWAPTGRRGAFISDLGTVISAVSSEIVRAATEGQRG